jgi:YHS domain-containing protein
MENRYEIYKEAEMGLDDFSNGEGPPQTVDPVCGMVVNEGRAAGKIQYAGTDFHFCSKDCEMAFKEDPIRYAGFRIDPATGQRVRRA